MSNGVGIAVTAVGLADRLAEWREWNTDALAACERVYVVEASDVCPVVRDRVRFSPGRTANVAMRWLCSDPDVTVILKTDVDVVLGSWAQQVQGLPNDVVVVPMVVDAPHYGAEGPVHPRWCGTVAATCDTWARLRGYDERMWGYGREDGDLVRRAKLLGMRVERVSVVTHVAHAPRVHATWYPQRYGENLDAGRIAWHSVPESADWGLW